MARKKSDGTESIGRFFSELAGHLDDNNGVFMSDSMTRADAQRAQKELAALANKYWEMASVQRAVGQ